MLGLACPSSIATLGCGGPLGAAIQEPQAVWALEDWVEQRGLSHCCLRSMHAQSCPTLCNPWTVACQASHVHGIFQASILEWAAISHFREFSRPRDQTHVSCVSCSGRYILYHCATWEAQLFKKGLLKSGGLCRHHLGPICSWALGHSWTNQCSCNTGKSELEDLIGKDPTSLQGVCLRFPCGRILYSAPVRMWENAWAAQVWDFILFFSFILGLGFLKKSLCKGSAVKWSQAFPLCLSYVLWSKTNRLFLKKKNLKTKYHERQMVVLKMFKTC